MTKLSIRPGIILAALLLTAAPATSGHAELEVRVPFNTVPMAAQTALVTHAGNMDLISRANVWQGLLDGKIIYIGRLDGLDGSTQFITVDAKGKLIEVARRPPPENAR